MRRLFMVYLTTPTAQNEWNNGQVISNLKGCAGSVVAHYMALPSYVPGYIPQSY
jgi:hypothetical protein